MLKATGYAVAEALRPPHCFTIMLPIVRPPAMLPNAVRSVLAQTENDFELCIICDGAPLETVACAESMKREDSRIRVFAFDKGLRHGEAHRAAVLNGSRADYVAQIGDDDLWFPDHLRTLGRHLKHADFVSLCQVRMHDGDKISLQHYGDLGDSYTRERMQIELWNFFGPTEAGYRLSAYRALESGWSPAPEGIYSDLFMWRKFLSRQDLRFRSSLAVTSLKFGANDWQEWSLERRAEIIKTYSLRLADPEALANLRQSARVQIAKSLNWKQRLRFVWRSPIKTLPLTILAVKSTLSNIFRLRK